MGIMPQMSTVLQKIRTTFLLLIISLELLACGTATPAVIPSQTPAKVIYPYHTYTAVSASPTPENVTPIPRTPDPTATPFAHTIEKGDTMLGIAIRYGVEVEDLQAVNPEVDPNMLSVGTPLIIPLGDDVESSFTTPTPMPISLRTPSCYQTNDGGLWCFILVENQFPHAIENVSARVSLISPQVNNTVEDIAFSPLNRIGPGVHIPLMVFFPPPIPASFSPKAELLTAVPISDQSNRYIDGEVEINGINIQANGRMATVRGQVIFPSSTEYPGSVWLAAVAYGEDGVVVGMRKWEAVFPNEDPEQLSSVTPEALIAAPVSILPVSFEMDVYSLGPEIVLVEAVIEVRP